MRRNLTLGSLRELGTVGLVAGLCGAYAAILIMTSSLLSTLSTESGGAQSLFLGIVAGVFILIALYVGAVVIVGAVDTVISGRLRHIALLRLLGSRGRELRRSVMRGTATIGAIGALAGVVVGTVLTHLTRAVLVARDTLPDAAYAWFEPQLLTAFGAITVSATIAGWLGSRGVLRVSPASAMAGSAAPTPAPSMP